MTDYSQLSDFEINRLVARAIDGLHGDDRTAVDCYLAENIGSAVKTPDGDIGWLTMDYCNNPADAWPIIIENKISTMWMTAEKEWCAWAQGDLEEGTWDWENVPDYYFNCESQLRAAMLVFLMMKGN